MAAMTTGYMDVAVGCQALDALTTAIESTAVGYDAGSAVTTGGYNTFAGTYAGNAVTTGANNTCIGHRAGDTITTGINNTCIGYGTDVVSGAGASANCITLGVSMTSPGDNYFVFGKASNEVSNQFTSNASWSRSSDERIKRNIQDDTLGLSFINALNTKTFQWKPSNEVPQELTRHYNEENQKDTDIVMHGLIAQEVKAALDAAGVSTFGGWEEMPDGSQSISREMFVIPLIKAIQELAAKVEALEAA